MDRIMFPLIQSLGTDLVGLLVLVALVIVGLVIIVFVVKAFIFLLPAAITAGIVWWLTGSTMYTGIAFLVIAAISLIKRK